MEPSSLVSAALAGRFFTTSMTWKAPLQKKRRKINSKDHIQSVSPVAQSYMALWDTMGCSTPGFPVHHQLLELAQIPVHWIGDAIHPPHPVLSSSSPSLTLSQHQGLFQWVSSSHQLARVLELQLQHQSFQWIFRADFLYDWQVWSPCSPRDSQESSPISHFKSPNSSVFSFLYGPTQIHTWLLEKP